MKLNKLINEGWLNWSGMKWNETELNNAARRQMPLEWKDNWSSPFRWRMKRFWVSLLPELNEIHFSSVRNQQLTNPKANQQIKLIQSYFILHSNWNFIAGNEIEVEFRLKFRLINDLRFGLLSAMNEMAAKSNKLNLIADFWNWIEDIQFISSIQLIKFGVWFDCSPFHEYYNSTWLYQSLLQWPWMKCC